jgi:hypothetical protein
MARRSDQPVASALLPPLGAEQLTQSPLPLAGTPVHRTGHHCKRSCSRSFLTCTSTFQLCRCLSPVVDLGRLATAWKARRVAPSHGILTRVAASVSESAGRWWRPAGEGRVWPASWENAGPLVTGVGDRCPPVGRPPTMSPTKMPHSPGAARSQRGPSTKTRAAATGRSRHGRLGGRCSLTSCRSSAALR